jgi:hypothetical protein
MKTKWLAHALAICAIALVMPGCDSDSLDDETEEVVEEQRDAADVARENPQDTAAIREAAQKVEEEQREAASAMKREVRRKGLDTAAAQSTTRN